MKPERKEVYVTSTPRPKPVLREGSVTLTLTTSQAEALMLLCAKVGGHPDTSRRGLIQDIYLGLEKAGVDYEKGGKDDLTGRNLYFSDFNEGLMWDYCVLREALRSIADHAVEFYDVEDMERIMSEVTSKAKRALEVTREP